MNIVEAQRGQYINYALNVLDNLISIPTVVPPGLNYEECSNYMAEILENLGLDVKIIRVPDDTVKKYLSDMMNYPRFIVLAKLRFGKGPTIHFNGHYDVVPAGSGWTVDPFKPTIKNGKIYGRGASDMKGGITTIILVLKMLQDPGINLNGSIEISFVPDEEIGGETIE